MRMPWLCLWMLVVLGAGVVPSAYASRIPMEQRGAWREPDVLIVMGVVRDSSHDGKTARHSVQISEVLKSTGDIVPETITIVDPHARSSAMVPLKVEETVVLFAQKRQDGGYKACGEIHLDAPGGADRLQGLKLFLRLMSIEDEAWQRKRCRASWNSKLSVPEKRSVLDAMWETRCPDYRDLLVDIAKGRDSSRLRSWAITILAYIERGERDSELISLLDDPDYGVRRQLLVLFRAHKVKEAVPRIEALLKEDLAAFSASDAEDLRRMAQEALDKITGKDASLREKN